MDYDELYKLNECDEEKIVDLLNTMERSFGLQFRRDAFMHATTFGELCDVVEQYIDYEDTGGCTSQQAFYRVRSAVMEVRGIGKEAVTANVRLEELFPRKHRRRDVKLFLQHMGVKVSLLTCKGWMFNLTLIGGMLSFVSFFFKCEAGPLGLVFFILLGYLAKKLGRELRTNIKTVEQLVDVLVAEHYLDVRRQKNTVNRKEITPLIVGLFERELSLDKTMLTRDASLI
jgi:hypothetical protein